MGKETISRTTFAKGVTAGVIAAASLGILTVGEYAIDTNTSGESTSSAVSSESTAPSAGTSDTAAADLSACAPGTYTASAKGISSDVTVTVTIDETGITDITADLSGETPDIGGVIGDEMIEKVLSAQSASVDGVAGATISSDAFKAAVEDCIAQASGTASAEEVQTSEAESETDTDAEESGNTEASSEVPNADDSESASELPETEDAEAASALPDAGTTSQGFTPGAYTASAAGLSSDVKVVAVFDESGITSLYTDVSGETPDIGGLIGDEMIEKALNAQSADIDGVTGATITSDAFKSALSTCIAMASSGDSADAAETKPDEMSSGADETDAETDEADTETAGGNANAAAGSLAGTYVPGTYTSTSAGADSDVTVTMTFNETSILAVSVNVSGGKNSDSAAVGKELTAQILDAQSADIEGAADDAAISDTVKAAAADCISQAKAGSDAEA